MDTEKTAGAVSLYTSTIVFPAFFFAPYVAAGAGHGFYTSPSQGTQSSGGQAYSTHYN